MTAGSQQQDVLDWTNASWERLGSSPDLRARAGEMAQKLAGEIGAGRLPFLALPFMAGLEQELAALESGFLKGFEHMLLLGIGGSRARPAKGLCPGPGPARPQGQIPVDHGQRGRGHP